MVDILVAAEALFASHGYNGVSMQHVAKAANTSKSNLYHHFQSKDDLYVSVLKSACLEMQNLAQSLNQTDGLARERLSLFSKEHLKHLNKKSHISKLILRELLDNDNNRGRELAEKVFQEHFLQMQQLIQSGQQQGEIRQDINPATMAVSIVGLNVFLFQSFPVLQHLSKQAFQHQESTRQSMFELLWHGFSSPTPNTTAKNTPHGEQP